MVRSISATVGMAIRSYKGNGIALAMPRERLIAARLRWLGRLS